MMMIILNFRLGHSTELRGFNVYCVVVGALDDVILSLKAENKNKLLFTSLNESRDSEMCSYVVN